ncbi:hypothetical protein SAMN05216386_0654 [Nitrosospira briensis]|uniref:Uncharacterized protein n=1 Tax=Nitrosospira briensis TaxID=35799 RepID=A0A1I4YEA0_9PROT|nr:hypothetical protein SAMN05216386_0654 [Nitrosospira briensis]
MPFIDDMKSVRLIFRKVSLLFVSKKRLPLTVLVICTIISIAALNGLARNIIQKRDVFSDPLCNRVWQKTHQIGHHAPPRKAGNKKIQNG